MSKTRRILLVCVILAVLAGWLAWHLTHRRGAGDDLVIYGNVDLRQVDLPFNNSERIADLAVQEGDRVHKGQVLASLETSRIEPMVAQAEAQVSAQQQAVQRLHNGSRPEEIAQARANVQSATADAANARRQYERLKGIADSSDGRAVSQQDLENAKAATDVADAKLQVNQKVLDLAIAGPRIEDVAQGEAQLKANQAQLSLLRQQLKDAQLLSPAEAVVRSRLMEPGEMASPQKPVLSLAVIDPKWVRAYVGEGDLNRVHPGAKAKVAVDSFPDRRFDGWVGFISPVAEFTPKSVQTEELRTSLVYEVRVFVTDPTDDLRLGAPASVYVSMTK